ncbi:MAG: hypothetical protein HY736_16265 [Verrucomicrobia bacterium]|nr:hypothetical protein [Verrucomicrobiota bacterium]
MKPRTFLILAGLSLISGAGRAAGAAAEDGALFRPSSFESACQAASAEKMIVFIARNGSAGEALREYLGCYDVGMVQVASFVGVRGSFRLSSIKQLGRAHLPALAALRERRDEAERGMLNATGDRRAAMDFAALNGAHNPQACRSGFDPRDGGVASPGSRK